jgi:hypothetical protein
MVALLSFSLHISCRDQLTEPLRSLPADDHFYHPEEVATSRRPTTRSRIGGSQAGGLRLSIVAFVLSHLLVGLSVFLLYLYSDI